MKVLATAIVDGKVQFKIVFSIEKYESLLSEAKEKLITEKGFLLENVILENVLSV